MIDNLQDLNSLQDRILNRDACRYLPKRFEQKINTMMDDKIRTLSQLKHQTVKKSLYTKHITPELDIAQGLKAQLESKQDNLLVTDKKQNTKKQKRN